jgi:hypothetical protein
MAKRGQRIRPCQVCGLPVNFVFWKDDGIRRYHWANPDGSHHLHFRGAISEALQRDLLGQPPKEIADAMVKWASRK